jgi:outer membrane protein assembly factor BamB
MRRSDGRQTMTQINERTSSKPLRVWPGVLAVVLALLASVVLPLATPNGVIFAMLGALLAGVVVILWWLFFSRAPWLERIGAILLMAVALRATKVIVHPSVENAGMGMLVYVFGIPILSVALVAWAVATRRLSSGLRRALMLVAILLGCGVFTLVRTGGIMGNAIPDVHWRWTPTPEELLLAGTVNEKEPVAVASVPATPPSDPGVASASKIPEKSGPPHTPTGHSGETVATKTDTDWSGFRGPRRDSIIRGVSIETDWSKSPPAALWRRPIGPGWSSFAVHGNLLYTQEQRGDDEIVAAYDLATGEPVWRHRDAERFWESNAGAGPRGTPTFDNGRIYALGATGIVNALDARDGSVVWSRNAASDTGATIPGWGFTSSPVVVNDLVIVATSGRLAGYDVATGTPRWFAQTGGGSYSSPHLMTIGGVQQVLMQSSGGLIGIAPADGMQLWQHAWPQLSIVQPALISDGDLLISGVDSLASGVGTQRIAVSQGSSGWTVKERWTSTGLKPTFNDYVVHKGFAFGFDGGILACIDLEDGTRKWKGGRYGHGQLVLLPDQDLLLVVSEEGELALVKATADQFTELARFKAIEGKTWNHPALVGDVLFVRNGEEMAAFRLTLAGR